MEACEGLLFIGEHEQFPKDVDIEHFRSAFLRTMPIFVKSFVIKNPE